MTLLQEIQRDALNHAVNTVSLLRKARVLAARLGNSEFESWILHELNGYPEEIGFLPEYRIVDVEAKAYLVIGFQQLPDAIVIPSKIPERYRHWATTAYIRTPITEIAALVSGVEREKEVQLQCPWPQELAIKYGGAGYAPGRRVQCLKAWQVVSPPRLTMIIETVRNKMLEFVLRIEAENPNAGEAHPGEVPVQKERVTQIFHAHISGGVAHIGGKESHGGSQSMHAGSIQSEQIQQSRDASTQSMTVAQDTEKRAELLRLTDLLAEHMAELKLDERQSKSANSQIATIRAQLDDNEPNFRIISEAGRTLRNLTEGVIGNFVAAAIQPTVWEWVSHAMRNHFPR